MSETETSGREALTTVVAVLAVLAITFFGSVHAQNINAPAEAARPAKTYVSKSEARRLAREASAREAAQLSAREDFRENAILGLAVFTALLAFATMNAARKTSRSADALLRASERMGTAGNESVTSLSARLRSQRANRTR